MMQVKKHTIVFYILVVGLLTANALCAQKGKKLDSIIKAASAEIYTDPDKVIKTGEQIVKQSEKNVDYKIKGYKLIADAYSSKRDYEKSLAYVIKANELLNLSQDELLKIIILNKMGIQYHQLKVYDKALQYLDQAEQLIMEYPIKDSIHTELGKNYCVRGFIYKEKLSCAIAVAFLDRGIAEIRKSHLKADNAKLSIAQYNKGNCYLLMSNNTLARKNFEESVESAKMVNAKSLQAFALKGLAKVFTLEGKYAEAINALKEALNLSSEVDDLILNQELYNGLSENYLAVNDWDNYKIYHLKYNNTQKLIKDHERVSVSESLGVKAGELKTKLTDLSSRFYYLLLVLFLLLTLIVLFFYVIIKRKRKDIDAIKNQIYLLQNKKGKEF
jgi:tetratricopeptide (TPR) repeat protein